MTILIAGGGIAGLTAALSLHQIGVECRLFETVSTPRALASASTFCRTPSAN